MMAMPTASPDIFPDVVRRPRHPERTCWGCNFHCPAQDLRCGNGSIRTPHPMELFGDDWTLDERPPKATTER
jgi:hypothetical protein